MEGAALLSAQRRWASFGTVLHFCLLPQSVWHWLWLWLWLLGLWNCELAGQDYFRWLHEGIPRTADPWQVAASTRQHTLHWQGQTHFRSSASQHCCLLEPRDADSKRTTSGPHPASSISLFPSPTQCHVSPCSRALFSLKRGAVPFLWRCPRSNIEI